MIGLEKFIVFFVFMYYGMKELCKIDVDMRLNAKTGVIK